MKIPELSLKNGFSLPVLGMGTWCFGGRSEHNPNNDDAQQIASLTLGLDSGLRLIDTAEYYAAGYAETLVGQAIRGRNRKHLFLTSKVWKTHLKRDDVFRAVEGSLKRLGTDYLDLYLYHQVSDDVPLSETIRAMNDLIDRGLVKHIGVSNFGLERLKRAILCSDHPVVMDQVHYNLGVRDALEEGLPAFCQNNGIILQAWRPMRDLKPVPLTDELCRKYHISFAQLALAFLLNQPNVTVITAMKDPKHIADNLSAVNIKLDKEDLNRLICEYPRRESGADVKLK